MLSKQGFFVTFLLMVGESHFPLLKGCWNFLGGWSDRQTDTQMEREEEDGYATKFPLEGWGQSDEGRRRPF